LGAVFCPFRGVSCRVGVFRGLQVRVPNFREDSSPVQRFGPIQRYGLRGSDRSPFDVCRFRPRPSGFFAAPSCQWVSRHQPSSRQVLRPPRSDSYPSTAPGAQSGCTSPGVPSPTAFDRSRRPYDPAGSNRRHRPSSGFHTLSTSSFTCNHDGLVSSRLRSWG